MSLDRATQSTADRPSEIEESFRLRLQRELVRRCRKNPKYSLRSFAQALDIDHSTLSQFLRGSRRLSLERQTELGLRLGLDPEEMKRLFGGARERGADPEPLQAARELSHDAFQVISDWYHYAIFELVTLEDFKADHRWIARTLGISVAETQAATERLVRLGLIEIEKDTGRWRQGVPLVTTTGNPFTATAFRRLQSQVLEMAAQALEQVPMEFRDQSSMTLAIPTAKLPEAKERIKKFRRSLCEFLQEDGYERDAVYQLGVSFYPLTPIRKKEK